MEHTGQQRSNSVLAEYYNGTEVMHAPSRLLFTHCNTVQLGELGVEREFPKNYVLSQQNTVPQYCYLVRSGQVYGVEQTESGDELIHYVMGENALFAEANVLFERPCPIQFRTAMPSRLICIEKSVLQRAVRSDSKLMYQMLEGVADKFFEAMDEIRNMKSYNAAWLLCDLLLTFAERYGVNYDGKVLIRYHLSIQLMTSMLGINRATTLRVIKSLKNLNLLELINGYYCIRSLDKLREHQEMISSI